MTFTSNVNTFNDIFYHPHTPVDKAHAIPSPHLGQTLDPPLILICNTNLFQEYSQKLTAFFSRFNI